jgi:hypothetical protein
MERRPPLVRDRAADGQRTSRPTGRVPLSPGTASRPGRRESTAASLPPPDVHALENATYSSGRRMERF